MRKRMEGAAAPSSELRGRFVTLVLLMYLMYLRYLKKKLLRILTIHAV
jgi:hypothetical protein